MPLSLKATVTHRQPEPDNSDLSHAADSSDSQLDENTQEGANEAATAALAEKSGKQLKREQYAAQHALQSAFLNTYIGKPVSVFLINGVRLVGKLRQFDQFTILLEGADGVSQLVFKHVISTIVPPARRTYPDPDNQGNK